MNVSFLGVSSKVSHYLRGLCNCGKVHFLVTYCCDTLRFFAYVNESQGRLLFRKLLLVKYIGELQKLLACAYSVSVKTGHFQSFCGTIDVLLIFN